MNRQAPGMRSSTKHGSGGTFLQVDTLNLPAWIFSAILITALPISLDLFVALLVAMLPILVGYLMSLRLGAGRRLTSILFTSYLLIMFIRPLFLYNYVEYYKFNHRHAVDAHYIIETLWGTADLHVFFSLIVILIQIVIRPINMRKITKSYNLELPVLSRQILISVQSVFFIGSIMSSLSPTFQELFKYVALIFPSSLIAAFGILAVVRGTARPADWGLILLYGGAILVSGGKS